MSKATLAYVAAITARRGPFLGNIDIDAWIRSCEEDLVCSDQAGRLFTSKKNLASVLEIWTIIHIIQNGIKNFCGRFCGRILWRFYRQLFLGLFFSALWAYFVYTLKECSWSFEDYQLIPRTTDAQWARVVPSESVRLQNGDPLHNHSCDYRKIASINARY